MKTATPRLDQLEGEYGQDARLAADVYGDNLHILTFQENQRGGDPVAHTYDGKAVFPDKYRGGDQVGIGQPWLCEVNSKGGSTFFAAPLARLDGSFFADLLPAQHEALARIALETHADLIVDALQRAGMDLPAAIPADAELKQKALETENHELQSRLRDLEEQYEDLQARLRQAEHEVRVQATEAEAEAEPGSKNTATHPANPNETTGFTPISGPHSGPIHVTRVQDDVLQSHDFTADAYYGHLSPDRRRLFLKPHPKGNLPCSRGRLHVPGMNRFVPFDEVSALSAHYDPRHGGYFIKLG